MNLNFFKLEEIYKLYRNVEYSLSLSERISHAFYKSAEFRQKNKNLYITFDDGPHPNDIVVCRYLQKTGVKVTFFYIGKKVVKKQEIVKKVMSYGHSIGWHSMNHKRKLTSYESLLRELKDGQALIKKISPNYKLRLYRPPFGIINPKHIKLIKNEVGVRTIIGDTYPRDKLVDSANIITERIKRKAKRGSIIILHSDNKLETTLEVLDELMKIYGKDSFRSL